VPLHVQAKKTITGLLMSNIYIGICHPKALTITQLWSYDMFEVLLIVSINNGVAVRGIVHFHLLSDSSPYWLA
jgi:hypothetical protein